MKVTLYLLSFLLISLSGLSQKIRFASSIGSSSFQWHENQTTIDLGAQLTFQDPGKNHLLFAKLKTLGNIHESLVDRSHFIFVEPPTTTYNHPLSANEPLHASYRGGQAEAGIQWFTKSGFSPIVSLYSKSIARKITSTQSMYIEEEKYALHGISMGLDYAKQWKQSTIHIHGQIFEPIYRDITLYGRYIGVPYTSLTTNNSMSYQTGLDFRHKKYGMALTYEILNFGAADNPNSKSVEASQANLISSLFTFYF